jgi:hypothetical protein
VTLDADLQTGGWTVTASDADGERPVLDAATWRM